VAGPVLVWLTFLFIGWRLVSLSAGWRSLAVVIVHVLAAVLTVWFVTGGAGGGRLTQVLSSVADVLGFWPVRSHPLAGLSYRQPVVEDLRARIREQQATVPDDVVVLVGHSQGSVLAAWTLADEREGAQEPLTPKSVYLVTCGSPLRSLYRTFFTSTFSKAFFDAVDTRAAGWVNVWRDTDPIATPIPGALNERVPDTETVRGHSDYWVEAIQVDHIASWHAGVQQGADPATP
jgi:pimeloyl-ACP methyl ester carboxylesterase